MSDDTTTTPDAPQDATTEPAGDVTDYKAKYEETLSEARKWEGFAKKDKDDAANWRTHQDSLKSKEQQFAEREAAALKVAEDSARELAVYRAAMKHGLSEDDIELLDGTPADAIEAKAEKLAARIASNKPTAPQPDPSQGPKGGGGARTTGQQFADSFEF